MNDLLDRAVATLQALPPAELLQWIGEEQVPVPLSADKEASFAKSLAQANRREFASDAEVRAIWAKDGL